MCSISSNKFTISKYVSLYVKFFGLSENHLKLQCILDSLKFGSFFINIPLHLTYSSCFRIFFTHTSITFSKKCESVQLVIN